VVPWLLLVTNRKAAKLPLPELAAEAILGGVDLVQVREKDIDRESLRRLTIEVIERVGDPGKILLNGSLELAAELGTGLHVPEVDRPAFDGASGFAGCVSTSIHGESDLSTLEGFDFAIAGHIFETASKAGKPPLGLDGLRRLVERTSIPVVAIGGITPERVGDVLATGARGVAVMSAINNSSDPAAAALQFKQAILGAMTVEQSVISVQINGKPREIAPGQTISNYLASVGRDERIVVVELNGEIIKRPAFATTLLNSGDKVEIVHAVGGG
jgi:thiamine-phosphate pyrophosphorylase